MADADALAAALEEIRGLLGERDALIARIGGSVPVRAAELTALHDKLADRVPPLLAAVEAALNLAGGWDAASRKVTAQLAEAGMPAAVEAAGTPAAGNRRAAELREAITRELTGEENAGG